MILPYMFKKTKQKKGEKEINMNPEDLPVAIADTCLPEHAVRLSLCSVCPSVSLQGQLADDDSNNKEEHAERQDAGA